MEYIMILLGYMKPEAAWKWPFAIGILFACLITGWVRKKAHYATYVTVPVFWICWLLSFIPGLGIIKGTWTKLMDTHVHFWGMETVREATVGLFGCFVITGMLGGSFISGLWYNVFFIGLGSVGFIGLIGLIAEKAGGKALETKIKKAKKGSPLYYWAKIRGMGMKSKKDAHGHGDAHGHDDAHDNHDEHEHDDAPNHDTPNHEPHHAAPAAAQTAATAHGVPCPYCGHHNPPLARFCDGCTKPIKELSKRARALMHG